VILELIGISTLVAVLALMRKQNKTHYTSVCESRAECKRKLTELGKQRYAGSNQS
jgi:hypothetical protein